MVWSHILRVGVLLVNNLPFPVVGRLNKRGPTATKIANFSSRHPVFKDWLLIPFAQVFNHAEVKAKLFSLGIRKVNKIPNLPENVAVEKVGGG